MTEDTQPFHKHGEGSASSEPASTTSKSSGDNLDKSTKDQQQHLPPPRRYSLPPHSVEVISVTVAPFTGGPFSVSVRRKDSVEELKKAVAKKLKVLKDRICLLYRERQLSEGTLEENFLVDGSRITLLPRAETGLLAQKPEQSVMQALESLNESQVVDFLSGKAPLNLTMRLGDHMMLIQLQLSTVNSSSNKRARTSTITSNPSSPSTPPLSRTSSSTTTSSTTPTSSSSSSSSKSSTPSSTPPSSGSYKPKLDTRALAEASKNLTQTLKQLSSEVLTTKTSDESERPNRKRPRPTGGAIIESMHHHGKGVYSGTFSGTLNPALQDRNGQPKRDITTIIHILNDLLCAQYKNYQFTGSSRSSKTPAAPSSSSNSSSNTTGTNPNVGDGSDKKANAFPIDDQVVTPNRGITENKGSKNNEELEVTKGKIEQLRKIMEERKERRRARREARAQPYSTSWAVKSEPSTETNVTASASGSVGAPTTPAGLASDENGDHEGSPATAPAASGAPQNATASDSLSFSEPEPVTA